MTLSDLFGKTIAPTHLKKNPPSDKVRVVPSDTAVSMWITAQLLVRRAAQVFHIKTAAEVHGRASVCRRFTKTG